MAIDIKVLLKTHFGELEEEKVTAFLADFRPEYKSKKELDEMQKKLDDYKVMVDEQKQDLEKLKEIEPDKLQQTIDDLQQAIKDKEDAFAQKLAEMEKEKLIEDAVESLEFSSVYGKQGFMRELKEADLKIIDGTIIGFNDFVEMAKKKDENLIVSEEDKNKPQFTDDKPPLPGVGNGSKKKVTVTELTLLAEKYPNIDLDQYEIIMPQ